MSSVKEKNVKDKYENEYKEENGLLDRVIILSNKHGYRMKMIVIKFKNENIMITYNNGQFIELVGNYIKVVYYKYRIYILIQ